MKVLGAILVVIAILIFIGGLSVANGAPQENVVVGMSCFVGILARIAQSSGQHNELLKRLRE